MHHDVLAARLDPLDVGDGVVERSPPHLLVQLGQLAGERDPPVAAAGAREVGDRADDAVRRLVQHDGAALGARSRRGARVRSPPLRGRKPSNTNRVVSNPLTTSAITSAAGPGTADTGSPACDDAADESFAGIGDARACRRR